MSFFATDLEKFGSRTALLAPDGLSLSYRELAARCDQLACRFRNRRQLLVVETRNDFDSIIAYLAALRQEMPVMLLDAALNPQLKAQILDRYQPELLWQKTGPSYELIRRQAVANEPNPKLALLLSTSGSTGSPKAVRLSADNIHSNAMSISHYLSLHESETAITLLPLHYSYGLSILNSHLAVGAQIVVQQHSVVDKNFWQLMHTHEVTSLSGVPFVYETLRKLRFSTMQLPHLRTLTQAGGRLAPGLVEEFAQLSRQRNWQFFVMYGQTEASARISYLSPELVLSKPSSIGKAIPGGTLFLQDENSQEIRQPEIAGELVYSGGNVMLGYAEKRADLLRGDELQGVLKTGDIARYDQDGDFYIVGRKKRFIKLFGQRFSLDEVENRLRQNGVAAACCGHDDLLQVYVEGTCNPADLRKTLAEDYRIYSRAIQVIPVAQLPKTSSGKVDYRELSGEVANG